MVSEAWPVKVLVSEAWPPKYLPCINICGGSSVVECFLAKEEVEGSNPFRRSHVCVVKGLIVPSKENAHKSLPPLKNLGKLDISSGIVAF